MNIRKKIRRKACSIVERVATIIFRCLPIQCDKIIFMNFHGRGYGCNPKYIAEQIIVDGLSYDMVWLVNDLTEEMPKCIRKVKFGTIQAKYELATAHIWIDNIRNTKGIKKRKNQYYIQTWHGAYGVKKAEKAAQKVLSAEYIKEAKYDSEITNLFISGSKLQSCNLRENYWYSNEILESGFPRDDLFYQKKDDSNFIKKIKDGLNVKEGIKIVLYAPTFRDNYDFSVYNIDFSQLLNVLGKKFGGTWIVFSRMHPAIKHKDCSVQYSEKIIDVTTYPDMQELMLVSDILITDYSSSMFEFMLLDKPIFIFAVDIKYMLEMQRIRELIYKLPFGIAENTNQLISFIECYDEHVYRSKVIEFKKTYAPYENGNASKLIVQRITSIIENKQQGGDNH